MENKSSKFLKRLQSLPVPHRKAIFWLLVIPIGIFFFFAFFYLTTWRFSNFQSMPRSRKSLPPLEFEAKDMSDFGFDLAEIERMLKEFEEKEKQEEEQEENQHDDDNDHDNDNDEERTPLQ